MCWIIKTFPFTFHAKLTETTIGGHDSDEKKDLKMGGFAIFDGDKLFGYLDEKLRD